MNIIYDDFKSFGVKVLFVALLLLFILPKAQLFTIHWTWSWRANDLLSKQLYKDINSAHRKLEGYAITKTAVADRTKDIYIEPNKELTRISSNLTSKKSSMLKFVSQTSYDYIKDKYPVVSASPFTSGKISNLLVRRKFSKKFDSEKESITNYLDATNYIPEGERLRLIQQALDKVIRVTLEDETY